MSGHHHLPDELERASADLDMLIRDVRAGVRNARHYDDLDTRGAAIAKRIHEAFRGSRDRPSTVRVTPGRNGGVWVG